MIKVGVVGCGKVAENFHIPCYSLIKDVEVVAIVDTEKKSLNRVSNKYGIKNCYENMSTMLKHHELDLVDITTPGFTHYELCSEAIASDVNVLVEKPLALSANQAYDLNHESCKKSVKVCVVQNYRFRDPFIELKKLQNDGKIGTIESIYVRHHGLAIFNEPRWLWNDEVSGGIMYELGIHAADILSWLMGKSKKIIGINFHYEESIRMTTSIQVMVKDEKGCIGVLDLKWLASSSFFHVDISATITDAIIKLYPDIISLRQGEWEPLTEALSGVKRVSRFGMQVLKGKTRWQSLQPHLRLISSYISSLKSDGQPPITIEDVIPTLELLDEIRKNIKTSKGTKNQQ